MTRRRAAEVREPPYGRRYEWRDTAHGPQLWDLEEGCWVLWYGIGAIGIADEVKAQIDAALNPTWGAADEALMAARESADAWRLRWESASEECDKARAALSVAVEALRTARSQLHGLPRSATADAAERGIADALHTLGGDQ